jgi:hypothetical protein
VQKLRSPSQALHGWKGAGTSLETETSLELVDTKVPIVSFPLQHTKGDQTAREMMQLSPLRTRLTAVQPELVLAHTDDFLDLRTHPLTSADLRRGQRQAVGGVVLGAVSDDQNFQPPTQPAALRPVRMAPIGPERLAIEPAVLLEATHKVPALVPDALQQGFRGIPGVEQHIRRAAMQPMTGVAQQLQGQRQL